MICKQCNQAFESTRKTAIYCSPACRQRAFHSVTKEEAKVSVTNVSVTEWDKPLEGHTLWGPSWLTKEHYAHSLATMLKIAMPEARKRAAEDF